MGYPPQYMPKFDMAQAAANGDLPSAVEISTELYNAATSINQCVMFLRAVMTADQKWKPAQIQASTFVIVDRQEATAGQTVFLYANSVTIDPSVATVSVFIDGMLLDPETYTTEATRVVLDEDAGPGAVVVMEIRENAASLLSRLGSTAANLGASLIGIEDVDGRYSAADVEGALSEVRQAFDAFVLLVGDLSEYLKADGSVVWTGDQDAGGNRLTDLAPGVDPGDAVIVAQLQVILAQFVDLGGRFLALTGGTMFGPVNMNGNAMVGLPLPAVASAAVRLADLEAVGAAFIPTAGTASTDYPGQGVATGPLSLGADEDGSTIASLDQTTDPTTVSVPTIHGVPRGSAPSHVVNLAQMQELFSAATDRVAVATDEAWTSEFTFVSVVPGNSLAFDFVVPVTASTLIVEAIGGGGGGGGGCRTSTPGGAGGAGGASGFDTELDLAGGGVGGNPGLTTAGNGTGGAGGTPSVAADFGIAGEAGAAYGGNFGGAGGAAGLGLASAFGLPSVGMFGGQSSTGVQDDVNAIDCPAGNYGGGGGGGPANWATDREGGGGGGGAFARKVFTVVPGSTVTVHVGQGGAKGSALDGPTRGSKGGSGIIRIRW